MSWTSSERLMYVQFTSCVYGDLYVQSLPFMENENDTDMKIGASIELGKPEAATRGVLCKRVSLEI